MSRSEPQTRTDSASRVVEADPCEVYAAFADAETLMQWLPPGNMTGRALEYDFRLGGRYRIELTYPNDATGDVGKSSERSDLSTGRFLALEPGERIVWSVEFESDDPAFAGEMIMSWHLEPVAGGTRVRIRATGVPSGIRPQDHDAGLRASLDNLARHVGRNA
ncbi:MAG TPA: SRPBCC domain-containing protein [Polyangiales bacterium]|nr:SRPBCC domain-containing protein [Polyangiales bacterium]